MAPGLILAVVLGAGAIPIPESVMRFPNSSFWPGDAMQREANMYSAVFTSAGEALRYAGPGPQQLAARWAAGQLNAAERVAVLLGGATYHDPALLPCYADALQSPVLRERQAAAAGFAWLIGERPPVLSVLGDDPVRWRTLAQLASNLSSFCRWRTLVGMWVDSYVFAQHGVKWGWGVKQAPPERCLEAIREIAQPADLPELIDLWPFLVSDGHRYAVTRTLEIITVQRLVARMPAPARATGRPLYEDAIRRVDTFVARSCGEVDGEEYLVDNLRRHGFVDRGGKPTVATWLGVLAFDYPVVWPIAAERMVELGALPATPNRQRPEQCLSRTGVRRFKQSFPVTAGFGEQR